MDVEDENHSGNEIEMETELLVDAGCDVRGTKRLRRTRESYSGGLFTNNTRPYDDLPSHIVRCIVLSDTHGHHYRLPPLPVGDVLIHLGDIANRGARSDLQSFARYLKTQRQFNPSNIICIQGNHDLDRRYPARIDFRAEFQGVATVLMDEAATIDIPGKSFLRIYGSSWSTCERDDFEKGSEIFETMTAEDVKIDRGQNGDREDVEGRSAIDLLLTHCPPLVRRAPGPYWENGSLPLSKLVDRFGISTHLFGHVHRGRGVQLHDNRDSLCINCATSQQNRPVIVDYDTSQQRVVNVEL